MKEKLIPVCKKIIVDHKLSDTYAGIAYSPCCICSERQDNYREFWFAQIKEISEKPFFKDWYKNICVKCAPTMEEADNLTKILYSLEIL